MYFLKLDCIVIKDKVVDKIFLKLFFLIIFINIYISIIFIFIRTKMVLPTKAPL